MAAPDVPLPAAVIPAAREAAPVRETMADAHQTGRLLVNMTVPAMPAPVMLIKHIPVAIWLVMNAVLQQFTLLIPISVMMDKLFIQTIERKVMY